ncbi:MAG: glycosyltransferase [Proteobacteria bacterium]|nr:glycosyltransferase [Pseudomonadota bacterium]
MTLLADATAVFAGAGLLQAGIAVEALKRFNRHPRPQIRERPPVTILKPLKGDEPLLEAALASFCIQSYPDYQIVFGVQDHADPAIAVVERVRALFPERDIALVVDETRHGGNGKVANLINMWPAAKHDIIVLADSDVHVTPQFLERMVASLAEPGVGAVTTLYAGLPTGRGMAARFGAAQINHIFLPGVVLGRMLGRQDCLGAALALRRETFIRIGGLPALLPHLADDAALGHLVQRLGLRVALAPSLVVTTVSEETLPDLFGHELRWARTIRALEPLTYATTLLQYPVFWALVTIALAAGQIWALIFAAAVWALRALVARSMARQLDRGAFSGWLLPLREILSIIVLLASYLGNRVVWRGSSMAAATIRREPRMRFRRIGLGKKLSLDQKINLNKTGLDKTGRLSRSIK